MQIVKLPEELKNISQNYHKDGKKIGFVPTMGSLHKGHLSLIKIARQNADIVVVSIYVNPTQFGPNEDFKSYPRTLENDIELLKNENVDLLFTPDNLYKEYVEEVDPGEIQNVLCGKEREGHFKGVATVVNRLFNIVMPNIAVFGQKDFQQFQIISRMVQDRNIPVSLIMGDIVREDDGLALSSRNRYLNAIDRIKAVSLNRTLLFIQSEFQKGKTDSSTVLKKATELLEGEVEYLSVVDSANLLPVDKIEKDAVAVGAMKLGKTRLIDNIIL